MAAKTQIIIDRPYPYAVGWLLQSIRGFLHGYVSREQLAHDCAVAEAGLIVGADSFLDIPPQDNR